jgi:hypothetical protein
MAQESSKYRVLFQAQEMKRMQTGADVNNKENKEQLRM